MAGRGFLEVALFSKTAGHVVQEEYTSVCFGAAFTWSTRLRIKRHSNMFFLNLEGLKKP